MKPALSVLLPARNAASTVELALGSVLRQSFADFEVIAIDDGSVDATFAKMRQMAAGDARVTVLDGGGRGIVAAMALGMRHAKGALIARMDADDESLPERFAKSVAVLAAEPELAGVGTQVEIFREDRPVAPNLQGYGKWLSSLTTAEAVFRERFIESPLCNPSTMVRREVIESLGGWREGDFPEDWEFWLRLLEAGHRMRCIEPVLVRWRDHEARVTHTDPRYGRKQHLALKAEVLARRFAGAEPLTVWGAGETGLKLTRMLRERGVRVRRFIEVHPRKVGTQIHGLPVDPVSAIGPPGGGHLLSAVGAKGAREEIRGVLTGLGWREGEHFTCVA